MDSIIQFIIGKANGTLRCHNRLFANKTVYLLIKTHVNNDV